MDANTHGKYSIPDLSNFQNLPKKKMKLGVNRRFDWQGFKQLDIFYLILPTYRYFSLDWASAFFLWVTCLHNSCHAE